MGWRLTAALSAAAVVTIAAWTLQRQWQSVRVPAAIDGEHAWKVKLIHFGLRSIETTASVLAAVGIPLWPVRHVAKVGINVLATGLPFSKGSDHLTEVRFDRFAGVPVKVYESKSTLGAKNRPALVYFHGGGFVWFSPDIMDSLSRSIAQELGFVVVSVDYRLAPEHPFPAAYDDCLAVTGHVLREYDSLGVDSQRVLVGGDSAGGNLAAAVAAQLKKRLRMQILIYPMLQAFDFLTPAYVDNREPFVLSPDSVIKCWLRYGNLSSEYLPAFRANRHLHHGIRMKYARHVHSDLIPPYLEVTNRTTLHAPHGDASVSAAVQRTVLDPRYAPLMADSLDDYPDAYIVTAQYDVLRDDGIMYAQRLIESKNVRVKLEHYKDGFHGFFTENASGRFRIPVSATAIEKMITFLKIHVNSDSR